MLFVFLCVYAHALIFSQNSMWKARIAGVCNSISEATNGVCSGRGTCDVRSICACDDINLYRGSDCEIAVCFSLTENDTTDVCSGHGTCDGPNSCNCSEFWGNVVKDPICSQALCYGVLANENIVCTGHGTCIASSHLCGCDFAFFGDKCSDLNAILLSLQNEWYIWFLILPVGALLLILTVIVIIFSVLRKLIKLRQRLLKLDLLDDIDLLIQEQKMDRDDSIAHLRINGSLFEGFYHKFSFLTLIAISGGLTISGL